MGKNYYCDYCRRSFSDSGNNRKKHLEGTLHQRVRKEHYDLFKEPEVILQEDQLKNPCNRFFETGQCNYGSSCRYSHLTIDQKNELIFKVECKRYKKKEKKLNPSLATWLAKYAEESKSEPSIETYKFHLPAELEGRSNLPSSLLPPNINTQNFDLPSWGV